MYNVDFTAQVTTYLKPFMRLVFLIAQIKGSIGLNNCMSIFR